MHSEEEYQNIDLTRAAKFQQLTILLEDMMDNFLPLSDEISKLNIKKNRQDISKYMERKDNVNANGIGPAILGSLTGLAIAITVRGCLSNEQPVREDEESKYIHSDYHYPEGGH